MRTLVNMNPAADFRAMEEMFDRVFGTPGRTPTQSTTVLPLDILERDNRLIIRAAIPGVDPKDLDIQVEDNMLTIRGESRHESEGQNERFFRREIAVGSFARSVRLPEGLNLDGIDAEFKHGVVTVTIPRAEEVKPKALKINVRHHEAIPARGEETGTPENV